MKRDMDPPRVPRNAPCPCGSGKRFKNCHGALVGGTNDDNLERQLREQMRLHEANEMLRKRQQGFGRPILALSHKGMWVVVVGNRVTYSPRWRFFSDFLLDNLKNVLGPEWIASALQSMPDHRLIGWLRRLQEAQKRVGVGKPIPYGGYLWALNRLGYALYLIEHNDKPPKSLVKRLRKPNEFDPACYEALVASAFALAGASIDGAEDTKGNQRKPEFFATFKNGKRYAVEAKRKQSWKAAFDTASEDFSSELRSWLRGRLHEASKKQLANPVYWFELGIGAKVTQNDAERLRLLLGNIIDEAETLTVKGQPAQPAYVVVTNNADFANDDATENLLFALFQGFRMEDFRDGYVDIEIAMERHDKHRDVRRVLECLVEVQQVPTSFEGVPDELLDEHGKPISTLKIGERMPYTKKDGSEGVGTITEITSAGNEAYVAVYDEGVDQAFVIKVPLTEQEATAAAKLGDMIFGKPVGPHETITDPMRFYDRMLEIHATYKRESLLRQLEKHSNFDEYQKLSDDELRVRVAREMTKTLFAMSQRKAGPSPASVQDAGSEKLGSDVGTP